MSAVNQSFEIIRNSYPEIAKKLRLFWGHAEFSEVVQELLHEDDGATPEALPGAVIAALLAMRHAHNDHFPHFARQADSLWSVDSGDYAYA